MKPYKKGRYSNTEISAFVKGKILCQSKNTTFIDSIFVDSRNIRNVENALFFAIVGKNHDGHAYISDLYDKGVRNFVVSQETINVSAYPNCNIIYVNDTLKAMQLLVTRHRSHFTYPVIGITGSNGKTIVKEWLYQLLNIDKNVVRNPKSYNSQVGVPLSVWQMSDENDLGIFEAGISEPDEMDNLERIIRPTIGVFTNIGEAHDEHFIHIHQKIGEKLRLFTKAELLIYCTDYYDIRERVIATNMPKNIQLFTWARKNNADVKLVNVEKSGKTATLSVEYLNKISDFTIPFIDEASIENAMHCWMVMHHLKYSDELIRERMLGLTPVAMRLELKEGINNCSVINDSYNSDLNSLSIAIDFLNQQKQHPKRTLILSDILQSARGEDDLYTEVANMIENKGISRIIGIGTAISHQERKFKIEKSFYNSTEEFISSFSSSMFANETILLKGARAFEFEQISSLIQQKAHETVLEINLNAIAHNLNHFRSLLKPTTKVMAMVKAFSYGSGSYEIANLLQFQRIDYLSVAYADEGAELRKAGITVPIMVMNPDEQSFDTIIKHCLEPEIYSFRTLEALIVALNKRDKNKTYQLPVHLKLDTGMHRLGFENADLTDLVGKLKEYKEIKVASVFTHLAATDEEALDAFTQNQIALYTEMADFIAKETGFEFLRHVLNSSGISRFTDAQFDMVRLGIGLYGIQENEQKQLMNVSTLRTIIAQIKHLTKEETVGYNRKGILSGDSVIATINIGYADGYNRKLGNGKGKVLINNQYAPIIGNICMDMCMIDITGIEAKEGDEVILFGEKLPVTELATQLETIPYEIFTGLSRRIKRIYYSE